MATGSGLAAGPVPAIAPRPPGRFSNLSGREGAIGLAFVAPWIVGFVAFSALPMIASLVLSFTDFDPRQADETRFVGLENYARMLTDPTLIKASAVTLRFALIVVPLSLGFALPWRCW